MRFTVRGIPQSAADEVRRTRRSPGYGHPALEETARGTGPCRCCLRTFVPGSEQRLLFTWRPAAEPASLMAPGPVFIHAERCETWRGEGFPEGLRGLPLALEARAPGGRVLRVDTDRDGDPAERIRQLLRAPGAQWLHLRHAEAGCFIARVDPEP